MKRMKAISIVAVIAMASPAWAVSIGLNFVGGRSGGGGNGSGGTNGNLVTGVAGVVPQGNWNNGLGSNNAGPVALVDDSGAATGATASWSGVANSWTVSGAAAADGDAQLMNGYLDTSTSSTTPVSITGVPYATYDVILYFDGDGTGRSGNYTVNGSPALAGNPLADNANWPVGGPAPTAGAYNDATLDGIGNYAIFSGQVSPVLTVTASASNFRGPLNGIQIINTTTIPEPTLAALGLMSLGALAIRRRRRAA